MKSTLESVREFICKCPLFDDMCGSAADGTIISANFLGNLIGSYSVEAEKDAALRRYADGGEIRHFDFALASRQPYGADTQGNLEIAAFYEQFAAWLDFMTDLGKLPALEYGVGQSITSLGAAEISQFDAGSARYRMPCRLTYYTDGQKR